MAVNAQSPAPYTAGSAVLNVIRRYRDKGLTTPITGDVLVRAGVSETLVPRTLQSLQSLELIDETGQPTSTFQKIRSVAAADYKACLAEWLKSVYADVFSFVDPAVDEPVRVRDAFRSYTPHGQQDRMVALFLTLCGEAGLAPEKKAESKPSARKPANTIKPASSAAFTKLLRDPRVAPPAATTGALPPALAGILQSIPSPDIGWTQEARDKFVSTFGTVLDFVVPIVTKTENTPIQPPEDEE